MARIAVDEEDLAQEFGTFDIKIQDEDVVDKLKELCMLYRLDASDMADEWMAFSISNNSASLTMDKLEQFEREASTTCRRANKTKTPKVKREKPAAVMHDISNINPDAEDDLLDVYSTPAAKGKNKRMLTTPENVSVVNKKLTSVSRSPVVPFSPGSFSPVNATPSQQYRSRSGAGETMVTFGEQRAKWKGQGAEGVAIQQYDRDNALTEKYKHMFYRVIDKSNVLNDLIEDMSSQLQQSHNMENLQHLAWPCQEPITVSGRVCCDMSTGRLNAHSVLLEGSRETSARKTVHLDLSEVSEYSLFPGQIVACDGLNTTGSKLVVSKFYQGVHLPFAEVDETSENLSVPVQVLVAAGPFTPSDSLAYEPLEDLLKYLKRDQPDVCVLKCTVEVPYDDMFKKIVLNLIKATEEGSSDRLGRLIKHILTQQSYYPLYPPSEDVNIDYEHYEQFCRLQATPDVLIIPSDLRYFVKDVLGCVCVNPGRITKAQTGGTFARFVIQCPPSPTQGGAARKPRCTAAEVVRV
uniref:DNA polymerase alpha subunit B n=1 Tax=Branchiostoma floridae TaxID=7739 RepID=C3YAA1_BRAFL|eukprot:XP_002606639.1 hypothetical protein BRAFLDRAFT_120094 [Branchiostoma floridae]